jgi:hypothetical protein
MVKNQLAQILITNRNKKRKCANKKVKSKFFFNVGPPLESIFLWPLSIAYISVINLHMLQITIVSWYRPSVGSFSCNASTSVFPTCGYLFIVVVLLLVWSLNLIYSTSFDFQSVSSLLKSHHLIVSHHLSSLICCVWTVAIITWSNY